MAAAGSAASPLASGGCAGRGRGARGLRRLCRQRTRRTWLAALPAQGPGLASPVPGGLGLVPTGPHRRCRQASRLLGRHPLGGGVTPQGKALASPVPPACEALTVPKTPSAHPEAPASSGSILGVTSLSVVLGSTARFRLCPPRPRLQHRYSFSVFLTILVLEREKERIILWNYLYTSKPSLKHRYRQLPKSC